MQPHLEPRTSAGPILRGIEGQDNASSSPTGMSLRASRSARGEGLGHQTQAGEASRIIRRGSRTSYIRGRPSSPLNAGLPAHYAKATPGRQPAPTSIRRSGQYAAAARGPTGHAWENLNRWSQILALSFGIFQPLLSGAAARARDCRQMTIDGRHRISQRCAGAGPEPPR